MKDYTTITSPEIAFERLGREFKMPDVSAWPDRHKKYAEADFLLVAIFEACNMKDGKLWEPDYSNPRERKWELWLWVDADAANPSGRGFSRAHYAYWNSRSRLSARGFAAGKNKSLSIYTILSPS